jgi:hypothetical protein
MRNRGGLALSRRWVETPGGGDEQEQSEYQGTLKSSGWAAKLVNHSMFSPLKEAWRWIVCCVGWLAFDKSAARGANDSIPRTAEAIFDLSSSLGAAAV